MTVELLLLLSAGAIASGFINGLAGFGTALFALGFWLQVMPPVQAVAIIIVMTVLSSIQGVLYVRDSINWRRLARFLIPAVVGIPLGIGAIQYLDAQILKLAIAGFLLMYGGFFAFRRSLPKMERPTPVIDSFVGFMGGVLGGAAGLSGALPTMWCALRPWPKADQRALLQPFNTIILALTAIVYAIRGAYTFDTLILIAIAFPITMISAHLGILVFKKLNDDQFRRLIIVLLFISGIALAARELI